MKDYESMYQSKKKSLSDGTIFSDLILLLATTGAICGISSLLIIFW